VAIPQREESMSLMLQEKEAPVKGVDKAPVVATKLYLIVDDEEDLSGAERCIEGVLLGPRIVAKGDIQALQDMISAIKRRLNSSVLALDLEDADLEGLDWLTGLDKTAAKEGMVLKLLLPGSRSAEELNRSVRAITNICGGVRPALWGRVVYPSNLFFMDELAECTELLAVDLDALARYMIGIHDDDVWTDLFMPSLRHALSEAMKSANTLQKGVAVFSVELLGSPSMLEHLVRQGVEILAIGQEEYITVRHIVASVEKRMLLDRARRG
jgi:hypothetical protein